VPAEIHHVIHPIRPRDLDRPIHAAIRNDQPFHAIKPLHLARQRPKRHRQSLFFIVTGDLDDQLLHEAAAAFSVAPRVRSGNFARPPGPSPAKERPAPVFSPGKTAFALEAPAAASQPAYSSAL
jgi:hypothetical protein